MAPNKYLSLDTIISFSLLKQTKGKDITMKLKQSLLLFLSLTSKCNLTFFYLPTALGPIFSLSPLIFLYNINKKQFNSLLHCVYNFFTLFNSVIGQN